jgi:hypothetical protein
MKNCLSISIASALLLVAGSVSAATLSVTPTPATAVAGAGNPTTPTPLQVAYNNAGTTADSIEFEITFNDADLDVSVAGAAGISCNYVAASGLITVIAFDVGGNTIASGNLCALTFTTTAGATVGETFPLTFQNVLVSDGGGAATAPTTTNGQINIVAAPLNPTTVNFAPTTVNLANGGLAAGQTSPASVVAVTTAGGVDPGSYSCTVPAGFQLTNASANNIPAGSDPADISVTCTLAAAAFQGTSVCTRSGNPAPAPQNLTLNCPAGQAAVSPVLAATPTSGTPLSCSGSPGNIVLTGITISNNGTGPTAGLACNTTGAGFAVQQQPTAIVAPGGTTNAVVACTVPADGVTINGTLNCSAANGGGALTFPLSSLGQSAPVGPTTPAMIPSTSLWAKIGLVGLLAALGLLVVGFRRHS